MFGVDLRQFERGTVAFREVHAVKMHQEVLHPSPCEPVGIGQPAQQSQAERLRFGRLPSPPAGRPAEQQRVDRLDRHLPKKQGEADQGPLGDDHAQEPQGFLEGASGALHVAPLEVHLAQLPLDLGAGVVPFGHGGRGLEGAGRLLVPAAQHEHVAQTLANAVLRVLVGQGLAALGDAVLLFGDLERMLRPCLLGGRQGERQRLRTPAGRVEVVRQVEDPAGVLLLQAASRCDGAGRGGSPA